MPFLLYQCKQCKRIIADENCILDLSKIPGYILMRAITGFNLGSQIQISTEGSDCECCFKNVHCECGNILGKLILSSPAGKDNLRHYWIDRSSIVEYSIKRVEDKGNSRNFSREPEKYFLGEDAERAAAFLRQLHEVERLVIDLDSRISVLEKK